MIANTSTTTIARRARDHRVVGAILGLILGLMALGATPVSAEEPRTLDEITIEGEIAVPQVLFITARDQHRYHDGLHHRYLRSTLDIGQGTTLPTWIAVAVWRQLETMPIPAAASTPPEADSESAPEGGASPDTTPHSDSSDGPHQTTMQ